MTPTPDIGQWFASVARRYPDRVAVVDGEEVLTFARLLDRVDRLAAALLAHGLEPGARIGMLGRNSSAYIVAYLAVARLGACAVLLNARWTASEVAYALEDTGAMALWYDEELSATVDQANRQRKTELLVSTGARPAVQGSLALPALMDAALPLGTVRNASDPDRPLMILHTSGTTGFPKGAVLSHANVAWASFGIIHDNGYRSAPSSAGEGSRSACCLVTLPLYHVAGLQLQALPHLLAGGSVALTRTTDPIEVAEEARRTGATSTYLLRFQWRQLADAVLGGQCSAAGLRLRQMIIGGGEVPAEVFALADYLGAELTFTMGMTEAGPQVFRMSADELRRNNGAIGRPRWYVQIAVIGEDGRMVGPGEVGELALRGPTVSRGYFREPGGGRSSHDAWFHTGDLVMRRHDGVFVYVDRKKDMIRSGGENVYAAEVERVLCSIPEVAEAAVVGVPHPRWGETVKAFVVLKPGRALTAETLIERARSHLAGYKVPRIVEFIDALPRNDLGRVTKAALRGR